MKRDMELIRRILLKIEESMNGGITANDFPDLEPIMVNYHFGLLFQAGFVEGKRVASDGEISYEVRQLRWEGHDFLNAIRSDTIWARIKARLGEQLVHTSFALVKAVGMGYIQRELGISLA